MNKHDPPGRAAPQQIDFLKLFLFYLMLAFIIYNLVRNFSDKLTGHFVHKTYEKK